ncbi:sulfotransferase [bacterium]|nr:sulfotransferase [bacterium]
MTSIRAFIHKIIGNRTFITVVSGLPRSGTSMMMSALQAGGMPLVVDRIRGADANNPKGYYEFERVKRLPKGDTRWLKGAGGKAVKVISALLTFLPPDYNYRVIFMERDLDEIMASQQRMLARSGKPAQSEQDNRTVRATSQQHLDEIHAWLDAQDWIQTHTVSYNDILRFPEEQFAEVAAFLDNQVDPEAMASVVDPALYREKKSDT